MSAAESLPLPDFDHLTLGSVESRIRSLSAAQLRELVDHEASHAGRAAVLTLLRSRLEAVQAGAERSAGNTASPDPTSPEPAPARSKASPQTQGPPVNPPSHGDPTNPAQPRG
jgi:hypothetical protein